VLSTLFIKETSTEKLVLPRDPRRGNPDERWDREYEASNNSHLLNQTPVPYFSNTYECSSAICMNNGRLKTHRLPNCVHHHYRQITSLIRAIIAGSSLADTLQRALFGTHLHRCTVSACTSTIWPGFADLQFQVASSFRLPVAVFPPQLSKVAFVLQKNAHIAPWKCLHLVDCAIRFQSKIIACDLSS